MEAVLKDVRIIDLTAHAAGPLATKALADLGAEVIKIELPIARDGPWLPRGAQQGDGALLNGEGRGQPWNREGTFNWYNCGKRATTLNLQSERGRELFLRLVGLSDVVVDNFSTRVLRNLRLEWDVLREANPSIIWASITGYGHTGPDQHRVAFGPNIESEAGLAMARLGTDGRPCITRPPVPDMAGGVFLAAAICGALARVRDTGEGESLDLSMLEITAWLTAERLTDTDDGSDVIGRQALDYVDSWSVGEQGSDQWVVADREALQRSGYRLASLARAEAGNKLPSAGRLSAICASRGIPASPVRTGSEVLACEHLAERNFFRKRDLPGGGAAPYPAGSVIVDGERTVAERPPPPFGEAEQYVYCRLLGLTSTEVEALRVEGVIADDWNHDS